MTSTEDDDEGEGTGDGLATVAANEVCEKAIATEKILRICLNDLQLTFISEPSLQH